MQKTLSLIFTPLPGPCVYVYWTILLIALMQICMQILHPKIPTKALMTTTTKIENHSKQVYGFWISLSVSLIYSLFFFSCKFWLNALYKEIPMQSCSWNYPKKKFLCIASSLSISLATTALLLLLMLMLLTSLSLSSMICDDNFTLYHSLHSRNVNTTVNKHSKF